MQFETYLNNIHVIWKEEKNPNLSAVQNKREYWITESSNNDRSALSNSISISNCKVNTVQIPRTDEFDFH